MKKNHSGLYRSTLALLLALVLMIGLLPAAALADSTAKSYVSLGDGATGSFDKINADAYPAKVAAQFGWELTQLAAEGMRAEDLRYALTAGSNNPFPADAWTQKLSLDTAKIQKAVSGADVISLAVGNANFGTYLVELLTTEGADKDDLTLEKGMVGIDPEIQSMVMKLYNMLMEYLAGVMPAQTAQTMGDRIGYALTGFLRSYNAVLDRIAELNPDAEIIVVGLLNAAADTDALNGLLPGVNAEELMDMLRTPLNTYLVSLPMLKQSKGKLAEATVYYAQADKVEMVSGYPSAAGHDTLAAAIIEAYKGGATVDKEAVVRIKDAMSKLAARINELLPVIRETENYKDSVAREYIKTADSFYVGIGDASAAGQSYVKSLAKTLDVGYKNYAKTSLLIEDVFAVVEKNKATIAKADLVTVGFTSNGFMNAAIDHAMGAYMGPAPDPLDWAALVGPENVGSVADAMAAVNNAVADMAPDKETAALLSGAVEGYAYSCVSYIVNMPKLIDAVHKISPEALVVLVGMYNPLKGLSLDMDGEIIAVGEYLDYLTTAVGVYGNTYAMMSDKAIYVAAPEVKTVHEAENGATVMDVMTLGTEYLRMKGERFLPSEAGHQYISDQILHALSQHKWLAATCVVPETCQYCGKTQGEVLPHTWMDATETTPKTCSVCGATEGEPLKHNTHVFDQTLAEDAYKATDATCTAKATYYKSCACGEKGTETFEFGETLAHTWVDATETAPKTCSVCGLTDGDPLEPKPVDGIWGDANGDGKVNAKDAMLVLQFYTQKITADKLDTAMTDVDGNGKLNAKDAMLILQFYTQKITQFPVQKV